MFCVSQYFLKLFQDRLFCASGSGNLVLGKDCVQISRPSVTFFSVEFSPKAMGFGEMYIFFVFVG